MFKKNKSEENCWGNLSSQFTKASNSITINTTLDDASRIFENC